MKRLLHGTLLIALLALFGGCERSHFEQLSFDYYPIISYSYDQSCAIQVQDGLAFVVELSADLEAPELLLSLSTPDGQLSWERETVVVELDQRLYVGSFSFLMPPQIELPTGSWKVEVIHPDGRALQSTFMVTTHPKEVQIPRLGFVDENSIGFIGELVEGRTWTVELFSPKNQRLLQSSLPEGSSLPFEAVQGAVKARYWSLDQNQGLFYRGESYLRADGQLLF